MVHSRNILALVSNLRGVLIIPSCNVDTSVSNKSEKWAEAFVLGWGLRLRWAEAGLCLKRAEVPERGAFLSDKIIRQRLRVEGR